MKDLLTTINQIKDTFGGDQCNVLVQTLRPNGILIRIRWPRDDFDFAASFSDAEINDAPDPQGLVDFFIHQARHHYGQRGTY